jgi:hypothetical protein
VLIVQWVRVEWTKASRGAPGAAARNAVPGRYRLPACPDPDAAQFVHVVAATEAGGFVPVAQAEAYPQLTGVRRLRLRAEGDGVRVRLDQELSGEPRRPHRPQPVPLAPGEWLCWRINWRFAWTGGWSYRADTIHLRLAARWESGLFLDGEPTRTVDELARLY